MNKFGCFISIMVCLLSCTDREESETNNYPEITTEDGFQATMIYSPSENGQGSWVSLTSDNMGTLYASDQYGKIYKLRINGTDIEVDSINMDIGNAQGLLWAHGGLYVTVNAYSEDGFGSGVYYLSDTDGDEELDDIANLVMLDGAGEHGPHALILGPDGESLYLIAGNHTKVPEEFSSVLNNNWREDRLFSSIVDPRGHANNIKPPGGWIARSIDRGQHWEVIASGFRNAYDIAFNRNGDLFTYDSDMEWDLGTPWYRPTRVCHVIPGAEFGWRTGSGKWPSYYPDNLPPVLEVGQGSPTGITFGYGARFPASFQESLFIADWSFGTIYRVDLEKSGASYSAKKKEFLSGSPLAITDMVIASDGHMYFTTGGRRGASYLYRVEYIGNEKTDPLNPEKGTSEPLLSELKNGDLELTWNSLAHPDRFVQYAARVALEKLDIETWSEKYAEETDPEKIIQASIAGARVGMSRDLVEQKLNLIEGKKLDLSNQLNLIRAIDLSIIRLGPMEIDAETLPDYPSGNPALDRELTELLVRLGNASVISDAVELMEQAETGMEADLTPKEVLERSEQYGPVVKAMHENRPEEQGIALALALSHMENGWTPETRDRYFSWFYRAFQKSGGMSYIGFLEKIRLQALNNVPSDERERLAELSGDPQLFAPVMASNVRPPEGPGKAWTINEALEAVNGELDGQDLLRGKELYQAALCSSCHRMDGEGGNIGPDLTQAGTRFSNHDLLMAIISPSIAVSDQYASTIYKLKDGNTLIGRPVKSTDDSISVNVNPYSTEVIKIASDEITSSNPSPVSPMPAGLINSFNERELKQLMAYIMKNK